MARVALNDVITFKESSTHWRRPVIKSRAQLEYDAWLYAHFYRPLCISQLRKYLKKGEEACDGKRSVNLTSKKWWFSKLVWKTLMMCFLLSIFTLSLTVVRVIKHYYREAGVVQMTCLATGFYPRHINLTLLQDGQEERVTGSELLPNPDGIYQMRKSVELSAEEQRERHTYTCTVTHLNLDNKLDISNQKEPGPDAVFVVPSVLLLLCVFGVLAAFKIWRRRYSQPEQVMYIPASAADQTTEQQQM